MTSGPRAAKLKANKKLDAQAKAFAEFQRENAIATRSGRMARRGGSDNDAALPLSRQPRGIRTSNRLRRGKPDPEEEWQSVPDEWLTEDNSEPLPRRSTRATKSTRLSPDDKVSKPDLGDSKPAKTGLESDESVSDLTDLSSDHEGDPHEDPASTDDNDGNENKRDSDALDTKQDDGPEEFIEWEMVRLLLPSLHARTVLILPSDLFHPVRVGTHR